MIDVLEHPKLAKKEKILATPTLIKVLPQPAKRIIGDLNEGKKVIHSLEVIKENITFDENGNTG